MCCLFEWIAAGDYRFRWVPRYEPKRGVVAAGEVDAGDLQVFPVNIALVQSDFAIHGYFLVRAAAHRVIGAFHHRVAFRVGEGNRAVFCVVHRAPVTGFGLDERLISIGIKKICENFTFRLVSEKNRGKIHKNNKKHEKSHSGNAHIGRKCKTPSISISPGSKS